MLTVLLREVYELAAGRLVDENEPLVPVLALWAKCFSHILLTMDDQEFFEQQQYFSIEEIISLSRLLNKIVFRMYWTRPPPMFSFVRDKDKKDKERSDSLSSLRTSLTSLIRQIYDRKYVAPFVMSLSMQKRTATSVRSVVCPLVSHFAAREVTVITVQISLTLL